MRSGLLTPCDPTDWARDAILVAVLELAEDGYGAVRVREIADRAGVSLREISENFTSKDHMLQEAWLPWSQGVRAFVLAPRFEGATPTERAIEALVKQTLYAARHASVVAAMFRAWSGKNPTPASSSVDVWEPTASILDVALTPLMDREGSRQGGQGATYDLEWAAPTMAVLWRDARGHLR